MKESRESRPEPTTGTADGYAVGSPPYDDSRNPAGSILFWVGIAAGVVFIVTVIFFSGFFIGRSSYGNFRGGYQPGMMGPIQTGPYGQMGPGMMGPNGQWPSQQTPPQRLRPHLGLSAAER